MTSGTRVVYRNAKRMHGNAFRLICEKRDHLGFFMKTEFLAWMDGFMYTKYNGESFTKKILITRQVTIIFMLSGSLLQFLENRQF